jgi:hypothetical protein
MMDPEPARPGALLRRQHDLEPDLPARFRARNQQAQVFISRHQDALDAQVAALLPQPGEHRAIFLPRHPVQKLLRHALGNELVRGVRFVAVDGGEELPGDPAHGCLRQGRRRACVRFQDEKERESEGEDLRQK